MAPRRFSTLLLAFALLAITFVLLSSSFHRSLPPSIENATDLSRFSGKLPKFQVPDFQFAWRVASHKPPEQKNSTSGESAWYSDWRWLNPFSSSITLDENRAVLPPLRERPFIYTYYETNKQKSEENHKIDQELLLTWRRAWWAHGFRPVVLGQAEALNNPLYERLQGKGLPAALEVDFLRWMAWGHMGTGLLSNWLCLPMGTYDDSLLSNLRRGQYPTLIRFEGLGSGLFAGEKTSINDALQDALQNLKLNSFKAVLEAIDPERLKVETPGSIAFYDSATITAKYSPLAGKLVENPAKGRLALNELMVAHLHTTWQNSFSKGIAVLKPLPAHTSALIAPSLLLANLLAQCPPSIVQSSCPPNRPKCSPCVASKVVVTTPSAFRNVSNLYTIGTVPHPYTMLTLNNQTDAITVAHIRRYTDRDPWLVAVTKEILGSGRGGPSRVVGLKDAVASEFGSSRSLWLTVEQLPASLGMALSSPGKEPVSKEGVKTPLPEKWLESLDWRLGFPIPRSTIAHGESIPPVPGPERWPKSPPGLPEERRKSSDPDPPTEKQLAIEVELLGKAREIINSKDQRINQIRDVAEAWNMADTEAWKFVRALQARSVVERIKWEEEEKGYGPGRPGKGKTRWWR